jgi:hypothetical protein
MSNSIRWLTVSDVNPALVILALSASDAISTVAQTCFSNDNMTWPDWGSSISVRYAQFTHNAGLVSEAYSAVGANVTLDTTVSLIENESRLPENEVQPAQGTKILVNVADTGSSVKSVTMTHAINNNLVFAPNVLQFQRALSFKRRKLAT